ncbi:MAG TPA: hypothetical protein VGF71_05075 [Caulobacteraceae bacterium]|jgi:hypothetical protein
MKISALRVLVPLTLLALAACESETAGPPIPGPPGPLPQSGAGEAFNEGDFAWSRGSGAGGIDGVLTLRDGQERYSCRGRDVILTPETPWVKRRMYILYGSSDQAVVPADIVRARTPAGGSGDYASYARKTTCDGSNRFHFTGLPSGGWYVLTLARPEGDSTRSVAVMRHVTVRTGVRTLNLD